MRKVGNKLLIILAVMVIIFVMPVFAADSCEQANLKDLEYNYMEKMVELLVVKKEVKGQKRNLIVHFCDTVLGMRDDVDEQLPVCLDYGNFRYDPRQSMFVYSLCVPVDEAHGNGKKIEGTYYRRRNYTKLFSNVVYEGSEKNYNLTVFIPPEIDVVKDIWKLGIYDIYCLPDSGMQACNFSDFLPKIFKEVQNSYGNMKHASVFGYKYGKSDHAERKKSIEEFSRTYFGPPQASQGSNECGKETSRYLNDEGHTHCNHPKTYEEIDKTIEGAHKLVEKVEIFKAEDLMKQPCQRVPQDNLMACAFSNNGSLFSESDRSTFQNLYTNELMYYNMFSTYYSDQLASNPSYNPLTIGNYSSSTERGQKERKISKELEGLSSAAVYHGNKQIKGLSVNYPLYIANEAYEEDASLYKTKLARLYTPLNQLYPLWRNVQACQD